MSTFQSQFPGAFAAGQVIDGEALGDLLAYAARGAGDDDGDLAVEMCHREFLSILKRGASRPAKLLAGDRASSPTLTKHECGMA
jgi:hypothetical protein